jgi:hypothetical protein
VIVNATAAIATRERGVMVARTLPAATGGRKARPCGKAAGNRRPRGVERPARAGSQNRSAWGLFRVQVRGERRATIRS